MEQLNPFVLQLPQSTLGRRRVSRERFCNLIGAARNRAAEVDGFDPPMLPGPISLPSGSRNGNRDWVRGYQRTVARHGLTTETSRLEMALSTATHASCRQPMSGYTSHTHSTDRPSSTSRSRKTGSQRRVPDGPNHLILTLIEPICSLLIYAVACIHVYSTDAVVISGWLNGYCHKCSHCVHTCVPVDTVYTHCAVIYIHTGRMLHIQYDTSLLQAV